MQESEGRISYWMQQVRSSTAFSQHKLIYLVGTHLDSIHPDRANQIIETIRAKFPRQRYAGIQYVMAVSCKTGEGISKLKQMIHTDVKKNLLPLVHPSWVKLYDYIFPNKTHISLKGKEKLSNFISRTRFNEIAKRCGLEQADIQAAAEFLQDIGVIILHQTDSPIVKSPALRDIVVLKPQWLADVMSSLISFTHSWIKNGFLQLSNVRHVFAEYPAEIHELLLQLLESFSIIHRIQISARGMQLSEAKQQIMGLFIPCALTEEPEPCKVTKFWPTTEIACEEVGRIYKFPFLPLGVIERLIVRTFHIPGFAPDYFWRSGCFLYYRSVDSDLFKVYLSFDLAELQLTLRMRTLSGHKSPTHVANRAGAFSLLIDSIDTILEEYKLGDVAQRFIPCSHCVDVKMKKYLQTKIEAASAPKIRHLGRTSTADILEDSTFDYSAVFQFTYAECIMAITEGDGILFCHHIRSPTRMVDLQTIAPDVALAGISLIPPEALEAGPVIGTGGFGRVLLGTINLSLCPGLNEELGATVSKEQQTVAIKEATVSFKDADYIYSDFRQEIFIMERIPDHPNIVKFYGVAFKPKPRMVFEYVPCGDLHQLLQPRSEAKQTYESLPTQLRLLIAWDIAKGMNTLHTQNPPIIHRDLRSPNIFMESRSTSAKVRAKVADFGLSRLLAPSVRGVLDTWQWLAPEVMGVSAESLGIASPPYDAASDVYSFAICCWEIATCSNPFQEFETDVRFCRRTDTGELHVVLAKLKRAVFTEHLRPTLPPPASAEHPNHLPSEFLELIKDCWKTNPTERPSFAEIVTRLEKMISFDGPKNTLKVLKKNDRVHRLNTGPFLEKRRSSLPSIHRIHSSPKDMSADWHGGLDPIHVIKLPSKLKVKCVCMRTKNRMQEVWVGCENGYIAILNTIGDILLVGNTWQAHENAVSVIQVVGDTMWSGSTDGTAAIWHNEGQLVKTWKVFKRTPISNIRYIKSGEGSVWVTGHERNRIRVFNSQGQGQNTIPLKGVNVYCLFEHQFIWVGVDKEILLFDPTTLEKIASWPAHSGLVVSIASATDSMIWSACSDGEICLWNVNGMEISCSQKRVEQMGQRIVSLRSWGNRIISTSLDHIILWDTQNISPMKEIEFSARGDTVDAEPLADGRLLVAHRNGSVALYKLE